MIQIKEACHHILKVVENLYRKYLKKNPQLLFSLLRFLKANRQGRFSYPLAASRRSLSPVCSWNPQLWKLRRFLVGPKESFTLMRRNPSLNTLGRRNFKVIQKMSLEKNPTGRQFNPPQREILGHPTRYQIRKLE